MDELWDFISTHIGSLLLSVAILAIIVLLLAGVWASIDPRSWQDFILEALGVEELNPSSDYFMTDAPDDGPHDKNGQVATTIEPFSIQYWNGKNVKFYADPVVWDAAMKVYSRFPDCDPRLITAVAFSESSHYTNFKKENSATALGIWQFITSTWDRLWNFWMPKLFPDLGKKFPKPDRTDPLTAAYGACVYMKITKITQAAKKEEANFIGRFMSWNRHIPQARFVYKLYHELLSRTGEDDLPSFTSTYSLPPGENDKIILNSNTPEWKKQIIAILVAIHLLPDVVYAFEDGPPVTGIPPNEEDPPGSPPDGGTCVPIMKKYTRWTRYHNGCEGKPWTCGAIMGYDYIARDGEPIYAPMDGKIVSKHTDGVGNTVQILQLKNGMQLGIMHLHFNNARGQVKAGDVIGKVGNIGNSTQAHAHIWLAKGGGNIKDHSILTCK